MLRRLVLLLLLPCLVAGCSSIAENAADALDSKGVLDVLKDASDDQYEPPADGKLTSAQIEMYLKVRKREAELAQAASKDIEARRQKLEEAKEGGGLSAAWEGLKAAGDLGNLFTADVRAAQELGLNTAEYLWVKGKILEVGATALYERGRNQLNQTLEAQLERMQEAREKATTDEQKQIYDAQIEALEEALGQSTEGSQSQEADPALAHNRELIAKYQDELTLVDAELNKYRLLGGEQPQENQ